MRRIQAGLALAIVVVGTGIVTASAWAALPEFSKTGVTFVSKSGTSKLEAGEVAITCKESKAEKGEITSVKVVSKLVVTFTGCEAETASKLKCKPNGETGTIKTNELQGELGYINKTAKTVGLELKPVAAAENVFVDLSSKCLPLEHNAVENGIIGQITPTNTPAKTGKLEFKITERTQAIKEIELGGKKVKSVLTVFEIIEAPLETVQTIEFGSEIEVKA
jgi:hypothetical protein